MNQDTAAVLAAATLAPGAIALDITAEDIATGNFLRAALERLHPGKHIAIGGNLQAWVFADATTAKAYWNGGVVGANDARPETNYSYDWATHEERAYNEAQGDQVEPFTARLEVR